MADIDIDVNGSWAGLAKVRSENLSRAAVAAGQRQAGAEVAHQLEAYAQPRAKTVGVPACACPHLSASRTRQAGVDRAPAPPIIEPFCAREGAVPARQGLARGSWISACIAAFWEMAR